MQQGLIAPGFEGVAALLTQAAEQDPHQRAQLSVMVGGVPVVDLAVGEGLTTEDLTGIFSISKGLGSLVIALLVQRGQLDPRATVASLWPEFAAAGKETVTVEQLLSHQAGLLGVHGGLAIEDYLDSRRAAAVLAGMAPAWEPGTAVAYHAMTLGVFVEELVRRITGRTAQAIFEEELRAPVAASAWLGLPQEQEHRYRPIPEVPMPPAFIDPFGLQGLSLNSTAGFIDEQGQRTYNLLQVPNLRAVREQAPLSVGGVASARGLAQVFAGAVTGLEVDGAVREPVLSAQTVAEVGRGRVFGVDCASGSTQSFGLGFIRSNPAFDFGSAQAVGHDGANGSLAFADPAWGVSFAYLPFVPQPGGNGTLAQALTVAVRQALMSQMAS